MPEVSGLADRRRQIRYHRIGELKELPTPARRRKACPPKAGNTRKIDARHDHQGEFINSKHCEKNISRHARQVRNVYKINKNSLRSLCA